MDCSPEGHQPPVSTRIFEGVQQPVCIVMAQRRADADDAVPARVRFRSLPEGRREDKFAALAAIELDGPGWTDAPADRRAPFLPAGAADWVGYPALEDLFTYNGSGVMAGRTWVIAPDAATLQKRWRRLADEKDPVQKEALFHPHMNGDRKVSKVVKERLEGHPHPAMSVLKDSSPGAKPMRYGFRSFDRQWIVPDYRLINRANPRLWAIDSSRQIYLTALMAHSPSDGPALTVSALIPDLHHYKGSFGGRVFPLWADAGATRSNVSPALLAELSLFYKQEIGPEDIVAYVAAVAAHPGYVERFRQDLKQPGLRIPVTASAPLFREAVALGREVVWLHTFGERFVEGRPPGPPRVESDEPTIPAEGMLPKALAAMPHDLDYDPEERRLLIGTGYVADVSPAVWAYEVSGKRVIAQWWSYRRKDRSKPPMGDRRPPSKLNEIQPDDWLPEYTTELLNVLRVLTRLVALEPRQDDLLGRIVDGPTLDADALRASGALTDTSADAASAPDDAEA